MPALKKLVDQIQSANSLLLCTHRQCDGDGLGAQLGLYHSLKKLGKKVRILNVDETPSKYAYLNPDDYIQYYEGTHDPLEPMDVALIMDTNDKRLVEPLYDELEKSCENIIFIDHHPVLLEGPAPTPNSYIDTAAASTGEIAFRVIKRLPIDLDYNIARAIYTSIVFDTQLFRYVRNSPESHLIAAELLGHEIDPAEVHKFLFANHKVEKFKFLAHQLDQMEYLADGKVAIMKINQKDLDSFGMTMEDSRDVIDLLMNVEVLVAAALVIETENGYFKISLRSKGSIEVRGIAESLGGGGHMFAAGATIALPYETIKAKIVEQFVELVRKSA